MAGGPPRWTEGDEQGDADAAPEVWEAVGGGYDLAFGSSSMAIARAALRHAEVQPGMRLLDVAAGSGALSIPAAELGAQVLATDLSPGMLALLRQGAREAGVVRIETVVMDGTDLDVDDQSFERVCSQFGVMLFPDTDQGLREMFRVTTPGGMGVVVIFGRPDLVTPIVLVRQALHAALPQVDAPPATRLQTDPMGLPDAMADAGYREVRLHVFDAAVDVGSLAGAWKTVSSGIGFLAMLLRRLPAEQVTAVREAFMPRSWRFAALTSSAADGEATTWSRSSRLPSRMPREQLTIEADATTIGLIQYSEESDPDYRHAGLVIYLDPAVHGRGHATDALRTLVDYLLDERGHHRVTIDPACDNHEAIRCYAEVQPMRVRAACSPTGTTRHRAAPPRSGRRFRR